MYNPEWNRLFIDLGKKQEVVRNTVVQQQDDYAIEIAQEKLLKPKLYTFPAWDAPLGVFEEEELDNFENMFVLCVRKDPGAEYRDEDVCYVWVG